MYIFLALNTKRQPLSAPPFFPTLIHIACGNVKLYWKVSGYLDIFVFTPSLYLYFVSMRAEKLIIDIFCVISGLIRGPQIGSLLHAPL